MKLSTFKKLAHIGTKKSDFVGYSYTCIINKFKGDAEAGFNNGDLTAKQRDSLIDQGYTMADRFSY